MNRASLRTGPVARWLVVVALAALALAGVGCSSDDDPDPTGLLVRTATGPSIDVTGTAWAGCYLDDSLPSGMSRLTTFAFGEGTFTLTDVVYTEVGCTGAIDAGLGGTVTAQAAAQGDVVLGWSDGAPPGLPATVTATAVRLTGATPPGKMPDPMEAAFFVNDVASPAELHMGGKEAGILESTGRPRVVP